MHYFKFAYVLHTRYYLLEEPTSLGFFYSLALDYIIKQFTPRSKLHDEIKFFWRFNNFIELDNVRMLHNFQNMDFSGDSFNICHVCDLWLLKDFYRNFLLRLYVCAYFNFSKSSFSNWLSENILTNLAFIRRKWLLFLKLLFVNHIQI